MIDNVISNGDAIRRLGREPWGATSTFGLWICATVYVASAGPEGLNVAQGQATLSQLGASTTIRTGENAFLDWRSFNLGIQESVVFQQPSVASVVWNRINDINPSQILGNIHANGTVVLANTAGFYFGPNSFVQAANLVVTTLPIHPGDIGPESWKFSGNPPTTGILNHGQLSATTGGSVFLLSEKIENRGLIKAHEGSVGLMAGNEVLISERPDGRGLSAKVILPAGSVNNFGSVIADAGTIALHARVVNQGGLLQADSVRERNGTIELIASESIELSGQSLTSAAGGANGVSSGGVVKIQSDAFLSERETSLIDVRGGKEGGNGGEIHLSAKEMPSLVSQMKATAESGWAAGSLRLDPQDIIVGTTGSGVIAGGTVKPGDAPGTLRLDAASAFSGFSKITLQATRDIRIETVWALEASTGVTDAGSLLTLEAGRDIRIATLSSILAGEKWSVSLTAGIAPDGSGTSVPKTGTIALLGTGLIETGQGSIRLRAGNDITVDKGALRTVGGGSISAEAVSGSVNGGTKTGGFRFNTTGIGYQTDLANLGGISTGSGGDIDIKAGLDIIAYLPTLAGNHNDGGIGAFGTEPGNVTLNAARSVYGHYVVRNGLGSLSAQEDAGTANRLIALSLVKGGWALEANNIHLQEVRNPNGIFNRLGFSAAPTKNLFDYDPAAFVSLRAVTGVELSGVALPRGLGLDSAIPIIFPPSLEIKSGSGGVVLGNNVTLFPSPQGQLNILTTDRGSLQSSKTGKSFSIVMSDAERSQFLQSSDFNAFDHAATPLHLKDERPVQIDVSGDMKGISIAVPKVAEIRVGGDLVDSSVVGQNLRSTDVTSLRVQGNIINRNEYTFVEVSSDPDFSILAAAVLPPGLSLSLDSLRGRFIYDLTRRRLGFQQKMSDAEFAALTHLSARVLTEQGRPVFDADGNPVLRPVEFLSSEIIADLHTRSQDIPERSEGYSVGGPGVFEVRAKNIDLGITKGIVSEGPLQNVALGKLAEKGADIRVELSGDLAMFSSSIRSSAGGSVFVEAGGSIDVGDPQIPGDPTSARGIFTSSHSDVSVIAGGDIQINGSRIAAYDGGHVFVQSRNGNVDAGVGGLGFVRVQNVQVNPQTREVSVLTRAIPGSGILATTFPGSDTPVGNIRVETPHGDIRARSGGIVQLTLNKTDSPNSSVTLIAGTKEGQGAVLSRGDIDAGDSGIIGNSVKLEATGSIRGLVVAKNSIDLNAQQNVNVTALASGGVKVNAGGSVSGTIVGLAGISATGGSIDAALLSQNVSASGNVTSAQVGFSSANASTSSSQNVGPKESEPGQAKPSLDTDDSKKRATAKPQLARTTGRVTVILPNEAKSN